MEKKNDHTIFQKIAEIIADKLPIDKKNHRRDHAISNISILYVHLPWGGCPGYPPKPPEPWPWPPEGYIMN